MQACLNENTALDGPALLLQIQTRLPELSPIMRSIGRYCVRMHARLHLMSIDEVSDLCGTVPSSVVRFARLLSSVERGAAWSLTASRAFDGGSRKASLKS
jgi:hypothetical protein